MIEICFYKLHTRFNFASLCFEFKFLISEIICDSKNFLNSLSCDLSKPKNSESKSVGVSNRLLRKSIKARQNVYKHNNLLVFILTFTILNNYHSHIFI